MKNRKSIEFPIKNEEKKNRLKKNRFIKKKKMITKQRGNGGRLIKKMTKQCLNGGRGNDQSILRNLTKERQD